MSQANAVGMQSAAELRGAGVAEAALVRPVVSSVDLVEVVAMVSDVWDSWELAAVGPRPGDDGAFAAEVAEDGAIEPCWKWHSNGDHNCRSTRSSCGCFCRNSIPMVLVAIRPFHVDASSPLQFCSTAANPCCGGNAEC